jgi:hypothetical protein
LAETTIKAAGAEPALLLNRVQSEMRNFHGVFSLGDFFNLGGDAVLNLFIF